MPLIYDVGAHEGEDTDYYLKKGFHVVAVEANPRLASALRHKFETQINAGTMTLVETAIAETEGEVEFFLSDNSVWGTIYEDWKARNEKLGSESSAVRVRAVRFEKLLETFGSPYYVKIDIEGADLLCVRALASLKEKPQFVSIESNKTSWQALLEEFRVFEELGYRRFKLINQEHIALQQEPTPSREGKAAGHKFEFGSSGLFGEDLPWRVQRHLRPGWYDTHAGR